MNQVIRADIRANTHILYRFFDHHAALLYVGITNDASRRFGEHSDKPWWDKVEYIRLQRFENRVELEAAELRAIESELPRYNVAGAVVAHETVRTSRSRTKALSDANRFCNEIPVGGFEFPDDKPRRLTAGYPGDPCPSCGDVFCLYRDADEKWKPADDLVHCKKCGATWTTREYRAATGMP